MQFNTIIKERQERDDQLKAEAQRRFVRLPVLEAEIGKAMDERGLTSFYFDYQGVRHCLFWRPERQGWLRRKTGRMRMILYSKVLFWFREGDARRWEVLKFLVTDIKESDEH